MKKLSLILVSAISGAMLMLTGQVLADEVTKIGKKIGGEATVIIEGKELSKAIIVDSKSYAPVRDIAEAFGATATYEKGVITIDKTPDDILSKINVLKHEKGNVELAIANLVRSSTNIENNIIPEEIARIETEFNKERQKEVVAAWKEELNKKKAELATLQTKLAEITAEIAKLETK